MQMLPEGGKLWVVGYEYVVSRARGVYRVFVILVCMCLIYGVEMSAAWDVASLWRSGEAWKVERDGRLPGVRFVHNDEKTSQVFANDKITFGDIGITSVIAEWVGEEEKRDKAGGDGENKEAGNDNKEAEGKPTYKLGRLICFVYSRGDNDEISDEEFRKRVQTVKEEIAGMTEVKVKKVPEVSGKSTLHVKALQWETEHGIIRLSYGVTAEKKVRNKQGEIKGRPEFIRLTLASDRAMMNKGGTRDKVSNRDLRDSVKHEEDGTVWIEGIPMVDQGSKGYCVPATLARVFAYYGMSNADMDTLAAVCNSDSDGGTSYTGMENAMKDIGRRYHLKIKTMYKCWPVPPEAVEGYNAAAKKEAKRAIMNTSSKDWVQVLDPELWVAIRSKKKGDVHKWFTPIRHQIDSGIPIIWSVYASGLYNRERGDKDAGGPHMRMIIGYNLKNNTIVYSDSWGKWATRRVMTIPEAYSITSGTWVVK